MYSTAAHRDKCTTLWAPGDTQTPAELQSPADIHRCVCVCVRVCVLCVFSSHPFWTSMDVPAGVTQEEGHTGFFNPPSFCGAWLDFCREKDSAIPFPRRP